MSGSNRNGNTSRARPLEAGMSTSERSRFRSVPAWQFTWTQRAKPLGRVGRPTLLTPERRQMVEAAAEAARRGERVMVASLARRLRVSRRSAKRYLCMVASEQGAQC